MKKKPQKEWTGDEKNVFQNTVTSYLVDKDDDHWDQMNKMFTALINSMRRSFFNKQKKKIEEKKQDKTVDKTT